MAWIESHQSLATHRKTMALESELLIGTAQAIGHLHLLWWWCLDNAPDGSLTGINNTVIAKAATWAGDPDKFVTGLIASGFLDSSRVVHDWQEYAGKLIGRRVANKIRMINVRATHVQNTNKQRTPPTVPNSTVPNSTLRIYKKKYGLLENVELTETEHDKLFQKFGAILPEKIEELSLGIASKGYKYKSHYAALLSWDRNEKKKGVGDGRNKGAIRAIPNRENYTRPENITT